MADNNTIARPYAQAIFEVAQENNKLAEFSETLGAAVELMADGEVAAFLARPSLDNGARLEFLQGLFAATVGDNTAFSGVGQHGTNFLKILIENGRVGVLPEIAAHFEALKAEVENSVDVLVTSATELSSSQQQEIVMALQERLGRDVRIETEIDENLIGGAVIQAGDIVIDGSLRSRLESLTDALVK